MGQNESAKRLVDEKVTRHDGSQENSLPPVELTFVRGRVGVGGNSQQNKPRPCGCNTRKLVNNRFPAHKGWGLRDDNSQSLIHDKNLTSYRLNVLTTFKKTAFTLAETLITLGVIGIVAAMTIPTLVQSYKKKVIETRLVKFYSTFNQAINLSQIDNGDASNWDYNQKDTYIYPYVKILKSEPMYIRDNYRVINWLVDGSLVITSNTSTWYFFPYANDFKGAQSINNEDSGITFFTFDFRPESVYYKKSLVPWGYDTGNIVRNPETDSEYGCNKNATNERALCARWIMENNWKIPEDYPFKF